MLAAQGAKVINDVPGVGKSIGASVDDFFKTGRMETLEKLRETGVQTGGPAPLDEEPGGALVLSDDVRPQNAPFVLQRALRNREHGPAAWSARRKRGSWTVRPGPATGGAGRGRNGRRSL